RAQGGGVEGGGDRRGAAVAEGELDPAVVVAAEATGVERVPAGGGRDVGGSAGEEVFRSGEPARVGGPDAIVDGAVPDLGTAFHAAGNVLFAGQEGVAQPVGDATEAGVTAEGAVGVEVALDQDALGPGAGPIDGVGPGRVS